MSEYVCRNLSEDEWQDWANDVRKWIKCKTGCEKANFFKDGIISEKVFSNSQFKPLFILKEVHDKGPYTDELQDIRESDIRNGETMWRRLVTLAREMHKIYVGDDNENHEIIRIQSESGKSEYALYRDKIAVINLKKAHGGTIAGSEESKDTVKFPCHACKYREILRRQITMINPSVIICCSTYDVLKDEVYRDSFSKIESITINGYHPSNMNCDKKFYDEVLEQYKAILAG